MSNFSLISRDLAYVTNASKILFSNVNFDFQSGDIVCLLGNNGAGKSTLLKVCAGVLKPTSGQLSYIHFTDKRVKSLSVPFVSSSWLPQQLMRPENFNIIEFLSLNKAFLEKKGKFLANELCIDYTRILSDFDLFGLENRELSELSGGEWKRVQLARIWAEKAKLLFLDEPESELDLNHKFDLIEKCKVYAQCHNAIIFISTHDLYFAKKAANKICALCDGLWVWNSGSHIFWESNIIQKLYGLSKQENYE